MHLKLGHFLTIASGFHTLAVKGFELDFYSPLFLLALPYTKPFTEGIAAL